MTEQELRQLVRGVIAERAGHAWGPASAGHAWGPASAGHTWGPASAGPPDPTTIPLTAVRDHASHALFVIPAQGEACIIEPAVPCNHCGYCKSYGH